MTRDLLKELDAQPSVPETDELREKFRIVKVLHEKTLCLHCAAGKSVAIALSLSLAASFTKLQHSIASVLLPLLIAHHQGFTS